MRLAKTISAAIVRLALLSLLLGVVGCQSPQSGSHHVKPSYYELTTFDYRGNVVAVWLTRGKPKQAEDGYRFEAVQRQVFHPDITTRYPFGKPTFVTSANVRFFPIEQPAWLYAVDGG